MFSYWLLGAGLPLVLFCLFFCLHRQCQEESGPILKESPTSPLQILEENVPNGNQRISLVEMDVTSLYESINENQVLSDLSLAVQSNGKTVSCQLKRSQSTSSEIADDILVNAYRNPYQPMKSDRESSNLDKYSTSNVDKSLQKPQCDDVDEVTTANQKRNDLVDVQNTSSTLLEADVVNLSDHERSSDDDTDRIIGK
jgi:RecJ-like exonuclease